MKEYCPNCDAPMDTEVCPDCRWPAYYDEPDIDEAQEWEDLPCGYDDAWERDSDYPD